MSEVVRASLKNAVKGTALVVAGMVGSAFLWFFIRILIVRNISVADFGIYALAMTIVGVVSALAFLGIQQGTARFVSTFAGEGNESEARAISRASLHVGLLSGLAAFALLYFLSGPAARHVFYKPELAGPLRVISFSIPFTVVAGVITNVMRGYGMVRPRVYYQDIGQPLYFLLLVLAALFLGLNVRNLALAFTASAAAAFISVASYAYRKTGLVPVPLRRGAHYRVLLDFSLPLMVTAAAAMVLTWTDTLMLGRYVTPGEVGIYNVSVSLARILTFVLQALAFVFLPLAGEMHAGGQSEELKRTYQVLTKWVFSATFPVFFVLFFFPEMTVSFLYGDAFLGSALPLRILSLGFLFSVFLGASGILLAAIGKTGAIMRVALFGALLNIALNYVFIKRLGLGVAGAAAATFLANCTVSSLNFLVLYRASGIHPFTTRYLKPLAGSAVIGLAIYAAAKNLPLYFWMMPVYLVAFLAGYVASQLLTRSIDREDVALFEAVTRRAGVRIGFLERFLIRLSR